LNSSQSEYRLDFGAAATSLSLQQFHVDTFTSNTAFVTPTAVPEPSTFALMGVSGSAAFLKRRRRKARTSVIA